MSTSKLAWKPWHQVVSLRDDMRTGELSLAVFAADLYDVMRGTARPVYQNPVSFFALTYPTYNLRELAKDVVLRLMGKNEKAVCQLELTYGGGKTHTLITLYHLVRNPEQLPQLPAVNEFIQHIGGRPPKTRVAVLAFDKLDVEKGMEVRSPTGDMRWLRNPWSVLAYQLAGSDGLRLLHADGQDAERESAPAENLMVELLALPYQDGLSTLILIDEVLMYAREKIGKDPAWRSRLVNFFQYLTQAATKVDHCAIVASLLATDPAKSDTLGKEITQELYAIFRREREESVQPVLKEDVAEVLRRRFFTQDSVRDPGAFRSHVVAALKGISDLDEQTRKDAASAEKRFLNSYPFHPDLTEVFYTKWTGLEGFQRTRGILRTFALALRDAEHWDEAPLIGVNVFIGPPGQTGLSDAARELTSTAASEEYEGKKQDWASILEGELTKARDIQSDTGGLRFREVEQAVFATFLHSQPIGQKALTRDLMLLLGATRPDKIELEKALKRWIETSWFLDEGALSDAETSSDGKRQLPKSWRLGSKPNLRQMHHDACLRVTELVEPRLIEEIGKLKNLTSGASGAGVKSHSLPRSPRDIEDDGEFHFAVLGPKAASESGKPSPEAKRFIDETTAADRPRVNRNAMILAVPSRDGLDVARSRITDHLGWIEVQSQMKGQDIDPIRFEMLAVSLETARRRVPEAIQQAYCIVATVSDKNEVQAFKITVGDKPLFTQICEDSRSRIQTTAVTAEALLPEGPYNLWRDNETSRRVKDLVGAFAQFTHLPKMLNRSAILDTIIQGCKQGLFVLRLTRPDRSYRSIWRQTPSEVDLKEPSLEVILPEAATLTEFSPALLIAGALPDLWAHSEISMQDIAAYFSGGHVVKIKHENYEEPFTIPQAERPAIETAIRAAVHDGKLWLTSGPASLLAEDIPTGILTDNALLQAPPLPIAVNDILPASLPDAWSNGITTALAISVALSQKAGKTLPWITVRNGIDSAIHARMIETAFDSGQWPCDYSGAQHVKVQLPAKITPEQPPSTPPPPLQAPGVMVAEAILSISQIQDLADAVADLGKTAVGLDLKLHLRVELGGKTKPSAEVAAKINELLKGVSAEFKLK